MQVTLLVKKNSDKHLHGHRDFQVNLILSTSTWVPALCPQWSVNHTFIQKYSSSSVFHALIATIVWFNIYSILRY